MISGTGGYSPGPAPGFGNDISYTFKDSPHEVGGGGGLGAEITVTFGDFTETSHDVGDTSEVSGGYERRRADKAPAPKAKAKPKAPSIHPIAAALHDKLTKTRRV